MDSKCFFNNEINGAVCGPAGHKCNKEINGAVRGRRPAEHKCSSDETRVSNFFQRFQNSIVRINIFT